MNHTDRDAYRDMLERNLLNVNVV